MLSRLHKNIFFFSEISQGNITKNDYYCEKAFASTTR